LEKIYKSGYQYQKVGVFLTGITTQEHRQIDLFSGRASNVSEDRKLMGAFDND